MIPDDMPKLGRALTFPNEVIKCDFFSTVYFFLVEVSVGLKMLNSVPFLMLYHLYFIAIGLMVQIWPYKSSFPFIIRST